MTPSKHGTALLVIDMQNGFCHEKGSVNGIGLPAARLAPAIAPCSKLIEAARAGGLPVIFTRYVYRKDFADGGIMATELIPALKEAGALTAESWDAHIVDELAPAPGEIVIDKNRPSAFFRTPLETILRGFDVKELVICGVTTNCCVETTVRDAAQRDYRVFVVSDAVAEYEDDRHSVALKSMGMLFAHITGKEEVLAAWR